MPIKQSKFYHNCGTENNTNVIDGKMILYSCKTFITKSQSGHCTTLVSFTRVGPHMILNINGNTGSLLYFFCSLIYCTHTMHLQSLLNWSCIKVYVESHKYKTGELLFWLVIAKSCNI